jgi:hypothetical protein
MSKHLESLYQNLLNGKLPHNLSWSEAVELVEHLGKVQPHGDDEFVFRVGSQRVFFKRPHTHDLGEEEVSRLRKFLKEAGPSAHKSGADVEELAQPSRMIVVIDHHAAHVYQDFGGSRPADEHKVQPYDPFNFHHHLIHRKELTTVANAWLKRIRFMRRSRKISLRRMRSSSSVTPPEKATPPSS